MVGTLGVGGQVAVRVLRPLNIRAGFSGLGIGYNFSNDGINYAARLRLEGAPATVDFFFFHGHARERRRASLQRKPDHGVGFGRQRDDVHAQ